MTLDCSGLNFIVTAFVKHHGLADAASGTLDELIDQWIDLDFYPIQVVTIPLK